MAYEDLQIIRYPDPRLTRASAPVERIDADLHALVGRMFELMYAANGIGLAAAQVGRNIRLFITNVTGQPEDERVYVNPRIVARQGDQFEEEGCLSFPEVTCRVHRAAVVTLRATNLAGQRVEAVGEDLVARAWQHEIDHLDGITLALKMTRLERFSARRQLKLLEKQFSAQAT
jgi:peptide deformylase